MKFRGTGPTTGPSAPNRSPAVRIRSGKRFSLQSGTTRELDGYIWRVMADPEGNEFDIVLSSA